MEHLKTQGEPDYDLDILVDDDADGLADLPSGGEDCDPLYDQALRIVAETRNASISFLQRKLRLGTTERHASSRSSTRASLDPPMEPAAREIFIDPI